MEYIKCPICIYVDCFLQFQTNTTMCPFVSSKQPSLINWAQAILIQAILTQAIIGHNNKIEIPEDIGVVNR